MKPTVRKEYLSLYAKMTSRDLRDVIVFLKHFNAFEIDL